VFERNTMGGLDCFCEAHDKSEWRVFLHIVISKKVYRQLCWCIDTVDIVFTFSYAVFYDCYHPVGFLKARNFLIIGASITVWGRRVLDGGCLLVMFLNCLYIKPKQTAAISSVQCEMLTVDVCCFM